MNIISHSRIFSVFAQVTLLLAARLVTARAFGQWTMRSEKTECDLQARLAIATGRSLAKRPLKRKAR
jgi:hypothetical protein